MPRHGLAFALASLACACSTLRSREPLVFALSREFYDSSNRYVPQASDLHPQSDSAALGMFVVLLIPFTLDVVLLPITVPRDCVYAR